jgi:8-oxo-dGTP pyrophosphatase MutT (NUDIX family)
MPPPKLRRTRTEVAAKYRFFDVLRHEIVDADTRRVQESFTFQCADWVSVVPMTPEGDIVFVRQYRHGIDRDTLEVPGGIVDEGEDPMTAGTRELREETGYAGAPLVELGQCHPNPAFQANRHHMYLARDVRKVGEPEFDAGEYCEVVVLRPQEIDAYVRDGRISHALVLLSLALAREALARG